MSPPCEERLAWLTGFTGSAGLAVVLTQEAAIFVDGRYTLQAAKQVDGKAWTVESLVEPPPESWISKHLKAGDRLGFDPWLHTSAAAERLAAACAKAGAELVAVDSNPVDAVWTERPPPPIAPVAVHGPQLCRRSRGGKARPHPGRNRKARRRCAGALRQPCGGLDLQYPRRRRRAYAVAAVLCAGAQGRPADRLHRPPQAHQFHPRPSRAIRRRPRARRDGAAIDGARQDAARRSRSTAPPPPTRSAG